MALEKGVRIEYMVENYYDRGPDGKLALKPELETPVREMFEQMPK
jgi:hypothetical protein